MKKVSVRNFVCAASLIVALVMGACACTARTETPPARTEVDAASNDTADDGVDIAEEDDATFQAEPEPTNAQVPVDSMGDPIANVMAQYYSVTADKGVGPADNGATFGGAVEQYCPGGSWDWFTSQEGADVVEYIGGISTEGEVQIQWMKSSDGWYVWAMAIDGEQIGQFHINTFFSKASSG